jgi:hypothetical protein
LVRRPVSASSVLSSSADKSRNLLRSICRLGGHRHDDRHGILYTPGKIAALLPNAWLYMTVWVFGGINALLGATVFAELGAMTPLSGGPYPFARRALGDYSGFLGMIALAILLASYPVYRVTRRLFRRTR